MARYLIPADTTIRNAKSRPSPWRMPDGDGLYLLIRPDGAKWWRFDYSIGGRRKTLSMGTYPDTGLKAARAQADEARAQVAAGTDPSDVRKEAKAQQAQLLDVKRRIEQGLPLEDSFEEVAREWFGRHCSGLAPSHSEKIIRRFERDIFPWLGTRPVNEISAPELLAVLRRIEERGAVDTAHRAKQNCGQVFRFAIATGRGSRDPSADLRGALPPARKTHLAAITDPKEIAVLLRAIDAYRGFYPVRAALKLAPLVFVRPGELRLAEWSEFDLDAATWSIPAVRMKLREPHLVPLARQAVDILRELHPLSGGGRFVFPGGRTPEKALSNNAMLVALRRMGYTNDEMTPHGFRAMARTVLDEVLGVRPDIIEHQLAHAVRDPLGRAYNRTSHLPERREMMQRWADYLDELKAGAKVLRFPGRTA
ncbi:MAG: integrase arm-type DNA-binding domain-containing protein [Nitrospirota bacterium]|nr:integrase arm-type DNA-binding domain-containing protein [Nitrospirota bacterium]